MKIHYMSDLHFDFYINYTDKESSNKRFLNNYLQLTGILKIPEDERNILIVPGDISNTNREAKFLLKELKKERIIQMSKIKKFVGGGTVY